VRAAHRASGLVICHRVRASRILCTLTYGRATFEGACFIDGQIGTAIDMPIGTISNRRAP
jgi:hypothetical protein